MIRQMRRTRIARQKAIEARKVKKAMAPIAKRLSSYDGMTERALDAWRSGNLTLASKLFTDICKQFPHAPDRELQNYSDMAFGCKIMSDNMRHPDDFNAMCRNCGHDRFWHVLQVACIQCLDYETQESSCKAFQPYV